MPVLMRIDQARPSGPSIGVAGQAREDLWAGRQVTLTASGFSGTVNWQLLHVPAGSTAALSAATGTSVTFTPDLAGYTYRIRVHDASSSQELVARVRFDTSGNLVDGGLCVPAPGERASEATYTGNVTGWHQAFLRYDGAAKATRRAVGPSTATTTDLAAVATEDRAVGQLRTVQNPTAVWQHVAVLPATSDGVSFLASADASGAGWVSTSGMLAQALGAGVGVLKSDGTRISVAQVINADMATTAAIATSKLGQSSAATGQALIWSGTAWSPSTNFGAQNLVTTGTLATGAATFTAVTVSSFSTGVVHSNGSGVLSSSLVVDADVSNVAPGKLTQASAAVGQALIWGGSTWGPSTNFGSQNLVAAGATFSGLSAGLVKSNGSGVLSTNAVGSDGQVPFAASSALAFGGDLLFNYQFTQATLSLGRANTQGGGSFLQFSDDATAFGISYGASSRSMSMGQFSSPGANINGVNVSLFGGGATGTGTGGHLAFQGGGGSDQPGYIEIRAGVAVTSNQLSADVWVRGRNIAFGRTISDFPGAPAISAWANMVGGRYYENAIAAPNGDPPSTGGWAWVTGGLPFWRTSVASTVGALLGISGNGKSTQWSLLADVNVSATAAIATSKLGQSGAATGQALVWSGSAWSPSTNFGAQNLVTTGTLSAGSTTFTSLTVSGLGTGVVHSVSGVLSSSLVVDADVSTVAPGKLTQASAATGQALVWSGSTWSPGTNFGAQAITAAGATFTGLSAGLVAAAAGGGLSSIPFGAATRVPFSTGTTIAYSGDLTFDNSSSATLAIGATNAPAGVSMGYIPSFNTAFINGGFGAATVGTGTLLSITAQSGTGVGVKAGSVRMFAGGASSGADSGDMTVEAGVCVGGGKGGLLRMAGGDSGTGTPGSFEILGGNGPGSFPTGWGFIGTGNLALGQGATGWALSDWHGGVRVTFFHDCTTDLTNTPQAGTGTFLAVVGGLPYWRTYSSSQGGAGAAMLLDGTGLKSTWARIADANVATGAAIAPAKIGSAGAAVGQALIWSGSAWAPSTNFGAQNLLTTGTLSAGAGTLTSLATGSATVSSFSTGVVHSNGSGVLSSSLVVDADVSNVAPGKLTQASAAPGQALIWSGSTWVPSTNFQAQSITTTATVTAGSMRVPAFSTGILHVDSTGSFSSSLIFDPDISTIANISPAKLGQSGAAVGQALVWSGTAWAPSTNFGAQNLMTTGGFTVSAGRITGMGTGVVHADGLGQLTSSLVVNADVSSVAAIATSKLGQSGAALGQALIWNGSAWSPGTDFAAQDLSTSGNVFLRAGAVVGPSRVPTAPTGSVVQWVQTEQDPLNGDVSVLFARDDAGGISGLTTATLATLGSLDATYAARGTTDATFPALGASANFIVFVFVLPPAIISTSQSFWFDVTAEALAFDRASLAYCGRVTLSALCHYDGALSHTIDTFVPSASYGLAGSLPFTFTLQTSGPDLLVVASTLAVSSSLVGTTYRFASRACLRMKD